MAVTLYGCSPDACYEDVESAVRATLFLSESGVNVAPDTLSVRGYDSELPYLYENMPGKKEISLPLNPSAQASQFVITIEGIKDTLTLEYSSFPKLISAECGYSFFHELTGLYSTKNIIDTVIIRNRDITTLYEENIRIFY